MGKGEETYGIGDLVQIVNYGHPVWMGIDSIEFKMYKESPGGFKEIHRSEGVVWLDIKPELVGKYALIDKIKDGRYSLSKIGSWYGKDQLHLIAANPNNQLLKTLKIDQ